jgi:hypothetical protein
MKKLLEIFEEPNGGLSSTRVVYVLWFVCLTFGFIFLTLKTKAFPSIPTEVIGLCVAFMGGKWAQRSEESKKETTVDPTTP